MSFVLPWSTGKSKQRYRGGRKRSIDAPEFSQLKRCVEELKFMNEQYVVFKKIKKTLKLKNRNFDQFYRVRLQAKRLRDQNAQKSRADAKGASPGNFGMREDSARCGFPSSEVSPEFMEKAIWKTVSEFDQILRVIGICPFALKKKKLLKFLKAIWQKGFLNWSRRLIHRKRPGTPQTWRSTSCTWTSTKQFWHA